ncbi:TonB-dependent receptor [Bacteroides sp. ET71]|uniref:SusC/RagA family TonB-linked outer membrane protein n=1 Tax=Bacteroides sp. ET71 TaxID=2939421 RepID=UPI0020131561|nr:TonB-dependent receptor [Bacteroides sp. ET71]MCL1617449.1 TonB-dependent receptor [Bacteroides sp. ET71]
MNLFGKNEKHCLQCSWVLFLLLMLGTSAWAQSGRSVTGRVSDEKGELLIGVSILEKGTSNGTITDANGQYNLRLTTENPILTVSYIGFKTQEVKVGNEKVLDIALAEDVATLDEVTVVAYGSQRKVSVVGAQSSMKMDNIKMPAANLSSVIAGRLAGVVAVQRTGEPGHDDSDIWIRGISTFTNQNTSPLVLVDGVERSFNNLDPEDIESFTILKDASATAVYGVRGANGVILIKTKPGKVGKPQFTADYYEGFVTLTKKPQLADAYTYMDAANEANMNTNGRLLYTPQYIEATKKAYGLLPNDNPTMYNQYLYPAVNWMDELFRDLGHNRRVNLSVRGGVPNATYYVSLTYYNETGLTRTARMENYDANMRYDRYNYTANLNLKPTKTTTIDLGFSGYLSEGNYPQQSTSDLFAQAMAINPVYMPLLMPDGSVPGISTNGDFRNPYADLARRGYTNESRNQLNSNIRLTQDLGFWKWSKGLSASALLAFDVTNSSDLYYKKREDTYWFAGSKDTNTGLWNDDVFDENGNYRLNRTYQGSKDLSYDMASSKSRSTYFEASLNYDRAFGLHRVGALFLYNQKITRNDAAEGDLVGSLPYKQQGIAARVTYSWNDRYFIEGNVGYNGSENFSPDKRFGVFPAIGVGWAISNEDFWEPIKKYVSYLKVRYTDGLVGTDAVTGRRFMYQEQMGGSDGYRFGVSNSAVNGWAYTRYGANVGWSTSRKQDLGIDVNFMNDALTFQFDFFKEHRTDIFLSRQTIPDYSGFIEMPYGNLGVVDNKGFEATMEYTRQFGKKVFLTVRGNFAWNEDEIVEDDSPAATYPWLETRGTNVNGRWGWIAEGLFTSEEEILDHAKQFGESYPGQVSQVGDIKYKDLNGDGQIDDYDRCLIGQGDVPKIYYGFGADLQVGDFSIGALFSGTAKADRCLDGNAIHPFSDVSGLSNLYSNITDRWSPDDPTNQDVFYPRLHYGQAANENNTKTSTWWQKDVSFLRLKQLTIAYNIPKRILDRTFLKSARVYLMGTNLLTFSKFDLWDPELNTNNGTSYPLNRTYSVGVNISF